MASFRPEIADRKADREPAVQLGVAEEHLAGTIDPFHDRRVVVGQRILVADERRRDVAEADRRERDRRKPLPAGFGVQRCREIACQLEVVPIRWRSPSRPNQRTMIQSFSARNRRPSWGVYSL